MGFGEMINMKNSLLFTSEYKNYSNDIDGTNSSLPYFNNETSNSYDYYKLANRYDIRSVINTSEIKSVDINNRQLFYDSRLD